MPKRKSNSSSSTRNVAGRTAAYVRADGKMAFTNYGKGRLRTGGSVRMMRYRRSRSRISRPERKYVEWRYGDNTVTTSGVYIDSLPRIAQGTGDNERIGRKTTIRSISIKGEIKMPNQASGWGTGAASIQYDVVRMLLVRDKQANGTVPNLSDIFAFGAAQGGTPTVDWRAFRNMDNIERFDVLLDRTFKLNNQVFTNGTGSAPQNAIQYTYYKKCFIPIEYKDTTNNAAALATNNLLIYLVGGNGLATWNGIARLRYTDV